jgi:hypothetical protein
MTDWSIIILTYKNIFVKDFLKKNLQSSENASDRKEGEAIQYGGFSVAHQNFGIFRKLVQDGKWVQQFTHLFAPIFHAISQYDTIW